MLTREELTDLISEAISDSIDMDWSSSVGARYVVDALVKEGVVTLEPDQPQKLGDVAAQTVARLAGGVE